MPADKFKVMIVAGEASGDLHGAKLVRALREIEPDREMEFYGCAGQKMREAGVEPVVMADELSIVGLTEIGRALPMFFNAFRKLKRAAIDKRPDIAVLVDFPDFNLKLAKSLKRLGIKVVYYISPQLWAWRGYRVRTIQKYVDLMLTILPFEKDWYAKKGILNVEYVGSPLAREVHTNISKEDFCGLHGLDPSRPVISLLPGSRHKEIIRIMPVMIKSARLVEIEIPNAQFVIAIGSDKNSTDVQNVIDATKASSGLFPSSITFANGETYDALNASDAAAITSGTATLEAGIIGTPMSIVYKTSPLNYNLLEPLISVDHYGLINLIAGKRIAKELIQDDLTAESLAAELVRLMQPAVNSQMRSELAIAVDKLGHGGASKRAAEAIFEVLEGPAVY